MATIEGSMEARLARVESKVDGLQTKVDGMQTKLDGMQTKVDRLQIEFEQVRKDIKKLGEGYERGLKGISNQIKELDQHWADKFLPHDLALRDHAKRIASLEPLEPR